MYTGVLRILRGGVLAVGTVLAVRFLLPVTLPFLLGAGLAVWAEPGVRFLKTKCRLPRGVGAVVCVTGLFLMLGAVLVLAFALLFRELGRLSGILPAAADMIRSGLAALEGQLFRWADRMPPELRPALEGSLSAFFSGGTALLGKGLDALLGLAGDILRQVPDSALGLGTVVISGCMISARLPVLKEKLGKLLSRQGLRRLRESLLVLKSAVFGWLTAQCRLAGITFCILLAGFLLLRVDYAPLWAFGVALVDAFPVLGTGTVLVPWAAVCFIQSDPGRGIGLLGLYAVAALTRSALEPRFVGRELGLDPLAALLALYTGYRFFGLPGMLLSPLLVVAVTSLSGGRHASGS